MTRNTYIRKQRQKLMSDMPRHLTGALVAVAFGGVAVVAGLWATHPNVDILEVGANSPPAVAAPETIG